MTSTLTESEMEALFEELPVSVQQSVARGEIELADVFERITRPDVMICPNCGVYEVPPELAKIGFCRRCMTKRVVYTRQELLTDLDNLRELNASKQAVCRERSRQGLNPRKNHSELSQRAEELLRAYLADGPMPIRDCLDHCMAQGITEQTVRRAARFMPVGHHRDGAITCWTLPIDDRAY